MQTQNFKIVVKGTGKNGLLMHNSRLSNPLDTTVKAIKKISGKRKKTDDDLLEMARLEHFGSMYYDPDLGPYIPSDNLWRCLQDAAKKQRLGTAVKSALIFTTEENMLAYKDADGKNGPRTADALWDYAKGDEFFRHFASVKVTTSRVTRCRPIFRNWSFQAEGTIDLTQVDWSDFENIVDIAGSMIGLGDWRPRYGRFAATLTKI